MFKKSIIQGNIVHPSYPKMMNWGSFGVGGGMGVWVGVVRGEGLYPPPVQIICKPSILL